MLNRPGLASHRSSGAIPTLAIFGLVPTKMVVYPPSGRENGVRRAFADGLQPGRTGQCGGKCMSSLRLGFVLGFVLALVLLAVLLGSDHGSDRNTGSINYSQFIEEVQRQEVVQVFIDEDLIRGRRQDGSYFVTLDPGDPELIADLLQYDVLINVKPPEKPSILLSILASWLPFMILIGVWFWFMRRGLDGGNPKGLFSFGKSRARHHAEGEVKVTFADVAGVDEAKEEVGELVEFLRDPDKFRQLGGRIPRGVLMVGPPGTGKTLLSRAIAGEARVPFFSISGSDFVEMFVGVGASRVRDLFEQAKKQAPCIIFIDELDAVGRRRGAGLGGGHDEREQTLNQLLVEMDGFEGKEGIIVIAATNRPDVLDPALLRPGRFDRQVVVGLPDILGREQILRLHMRALPVAVDVEPRVIARGTPGFSGADLANLVNEAALLTARQNLHQVSMEMFERAKDKVLMGAERRSLVMSEEMKRLTAYHEAGHAILGFLVPEQDPVHKVSIIPRGRALGLTLFLPEQDRYSSSRRRIESQITCLFGGRLAETLIFGPDAVTTGAQNDIQRATSLARGMVTKWGLSDNLGPMAYEDEDEEIFLGGAVTRHRAQSKATEESIDREVRAIIDRNYNRAQQLLMAHMDTLHKLAAALLAHETLNWEQIKAILEGRWDGRGNESGSPPPSAKPTPPANPPAGLKIPPVGV